MAFRILRCFKLNFVTVVHIKYLNNTRTVECSCYQKYTSQLDAKEKKKLKLEGQIA
jgi:hypothetical protein